VTFYYNPNISNETIIIFLFSISLIVGSLGLYFGTIYRRKLNEVMNKRMIILTDVIVIFIMVWFTLQSINFWFFEGRYDGTTIENAWIIVDVYYNMGFAFIVYILMFISMKIGRRREKENDVNREVQTPYIR